MKDITTHDRMQAKKQLLPQIFADSKPNPFTNYYIHMRLKKTSYGKIGYAWMIKIQQTLSFMPKCKLLIKSFHTRGPPFILKTKKVSTDHFYFFRLSMMLINNHPVVLPD